MAVGAGILRTPGEIAAALPSPGWILAVWLLGAVVATLDVLILAEMAASVPRVGGLVAYVRLSFGRPTAFLVGWSMLLVTWPASLASVAVSIGELLSTGASALTLTAPPSESGKAIALAVISTFGAINLFGLRVGARFEVLLVVFKLLLLGGLCVAAAWLAPQTDAVAAASPPFPATWPTLLAAIGTAMTAVVFSYDGYADAVYLGGETRDPGRSLPRALFAALAAITVLYLATNLAFLWVLGVDGLAATKFAALDVVARAFGPTGAKVLTAIAVIVMLGAVNAYFLTGPRIARVLAEEGLAVPVLGHMTASGAPVAATLWIVGVAAAFAYSNTFAGLLEVIVPFMAATTALVAAGLLVQRRRAPERPRPFRVPGAPLVVALQLAIGIALLASFVAANPTALLIDLGALVVGLLIYVTCCRKRQTPG
jgi:APA family basic amino acid/polyamine antiporter